MIGRKAPPPDEEDQGLRGFDDFDLRLGDVLRGERATLGKSLLDVQRELRIKANYIAAIESADASAFESPGFIAGYVRSYARYLGLDPTWAFDEFCKESGFCGAQGLSGHAGFVEDTASSWNVAPGLASVSAPAKPAGAPRAPRRKTPRDPLLNTKAPFVPDRRSPLAGVEPGALGSVMVLMLLIGGLAYGGLTVLHQVQQVNVVPVEDTPVIAATLDPVTGAMPGGTSDVLEDTVLAGALDRLYRPEALDVPVMVARDGPIAELDPESVGALARTARPRLLTQAPETPMALAGAAPADAPLAAPPAAALEPGDTVKVLADAAPGVELFAVRPAWVRVTGADGSVLFEKILDAGERYTLPRTAQAPSLRAGNSGSVYFLVNGQTYGPAGPGAGVVKGVELGAGDITDVYSPADPRQDEDLSRAVAELNAAQDG